MNLTQAENNLYRVETDLLGSRQVPADAYYGIHTLRAAENFQISGVPIGRYSELIEALACGVERSIGVVTALNPYIGYNNATSIAKEALESGSAIPEIVLAKGLLGKEDLDDILRPEALTRPRVRPAEIEEKPE